MTIDPKKVKRHLNFRSKTLGDAVIYTAIEFLNGTTSCNCPGWVFKRGSKSRSCTHTKMLTGAKKIDRSLVISDAQMRPIVEASPSRYNDLADLITGGGRREIEL